MCRINRLGNLPGGAMGRTSDARERLIAAAMGLMHESGYTAVGVSEICQRAGVKRGSFFHFLPSTRDLTLEVIEAQWNEIESEVVKQAFDPSRPPIDRIASLFTKMSEYPRSREQSTGRWLGCPFGILGAELSGQDEDIRRKIVDVFARLSGYLEGALAEIKSDPQYRQLDVQASSRALMAYFEGAMLMAKVSHRGTMFDELAGASLPLVFAA